MKLSTRLTLAMLTLVLLTTAILGFSSYYSLEKAILPGELSRLQMHAQQLGMLLEAEVRSASNTLLATRGIPSVGAIIRTRQNGGVDPYDGSTEEQWRERLAVTFIAQLNAHPHFTQLRYLGVAGEGREIVRVDRSGPAGAIRTLEEHELQSKSHRDYFQDISTLQPDQIYVSKIDLNQEWGAIEKPNVPVLRLGTPVFTPENQLFGMIIINIDMGPILEQLRAEKLPESILYMVDENGDFLLHPDSSREFGFDRGQRHLVQNEHPEWGNLLGQQTANARLVGSKTVAANGVAWVPLKLGGSRPLGIIEVLPYSTMVASINPLRHSALMTAALAVVLAIFLAILLSHSMVKPLVQIIRALETFTGEGKMPVPTDAPGEVGILARAFERMAAEVQRKTEDLRIEIEEHRQTEQELERNIEQVRLYSAVLESMEDAAVTQALDGRVIGWNPAARHLFQYEAHQMLGDNIERIIPPAQRELVEQAIGKARQGQGAVRLESELMDKNGAAIPVSLTISPVHDPDGQLIGVSIIARDNTQRNAIEDQLRQAQKMEAIGLLAGGVAHDFNNLLTVINGCTEFMLEVPCEPPESRKMLEEIGQAGQRAAGLTSQLLAFSRKSMIKPQPVDLKNLLDQLSKMLQRLIGEDVQLTLLQDEQLPLVMADPAQIEQIIMNLTVNARDAMPTGGKLIIETRTSQLDETYAASHVDVKPGPYVLLSISDNGHGMDQKTREHIFEPFFSTKERGKGTGLGLATVYGIVKQNHGHISCYSEPGRGTTFKIYLPLCTEHIQSSAQQPSQPAQVCGGSETILVAEDEQGVRRLARLILESNGYRVLEAANCRDALQLVRHYEGTIDLVLSDVVMPQMSGPQLVEMIQTARPQIKVIYMSGYTDDAVVRYGVLQSHVPFLQKPFTANVLASKVRQVLDAQTGVPHSHSTLQDD